jgi:RNA polymerase sigma factor (sigma-70 family)
MSTQSDPSPTLTSTRTLILRIRKGDARAREELFARFLPALRRWARGRLPGWARSLADTDDLVQVSLVRALGRVEEFDPRRQGAFLAYLHQILLNCIREEIRRAGRRPAAEPLEADLPEDRPQLLERTLGASAVETYGAALSELPERQQQAVILRIEFGFSYVEIAGILGGTTPDAVRMQVTRGLVRLAEKMDAFA